MLRRRLWDSSCPRGRGVPVASRRAIRTWGRRRRVRRSRGYGSRCSRRSAPGTRPGRPAGRWRPGRRGRWRERTRPARRSRAGRRGSRGRSSGRAARSGAGAWAAVVVGAIGVPTWHGELGGRARAAPGHRSRGLPGCATGARAGIERRSCHKGRCVSTTASEMQKKKIEARKSPSHGNGVFAIAPIRKGERIIQYRGKLRTHDEVDEEYGDEDEDGHTFLFTLNDHYVIDANIRGNVARWINHSCDPNCESEVEEDPKGRPEKDKVFIVALRNIRPGEELTYNYGIVLDEPHTPKLKKLWGCRCGAKNCTGTMLQPKR